MWSDKRVIVNKGEFLKDLLLYPDVLLNQAMTPWIVNSLMILVWYYGGMEELTWLYFAPTFLSNNSEQLGNSIAHMYGDRAYACGQSPNCDSRNVWWLSIAMLGENWHNNHHAFASSARQGFEWYQIDISYWFILAFYYMGLITSIREPVKSVLAPYGETTRNEAIKTD